MAVEDYEAVRRHPARFINAPDHDVAARDWARVVSERNGYVVVEKVGEAKEVAEELAGGDTRAEPAGT